MTKRLIINADDLGMTAGINRAVLELAATGAVTSATLMAGGRAMEQAAARAPSCGIGCHLVLVDGQPTSEPGAVASLLAAGRLRSTLGAFLRDLALGRIREEEIELEAAAQIRRLQGFGLRLTHVDTHKHTHMFPRVLRPVLRAARACGVAAIRNPFEPAWSRRATPRAPLLRRMEVGLLSRLRGAFLREVAQAGLVTTAGAVGVLATGTLDEAALARLLAALPEGTWELVTHPGYCDPDLEAASTRLTVSREVERRALSRLPAMAAGVQCISFAQMAEGGSGHATH